MKYSRIILGTLACAASLGLGAASPVAPGAAAFYERARAMYDAYNYTGVIDQLGRYLDTAPETCADSRDQRAEATLLLMQASVLHGDFGHMRDLYKRFASRYTGSPLMMQATALLADTYFYEGEYGEAVRIYGQVSLDVLPFSMAGDTRMHYALSLLRCGYFDEAEDYFDGLVHDSEYSGKAAFYLAYLDYVRYRYREALQKFRSLPAGVSHDMGADFYIAQIQFAGGGYTDVLAMREPLMAAARRIDSPEIDAVSESHRIIGESLYATGDKRGAREELGRHIGMSGENAARSARYLAGVMAYEDGLYDQARNLLSGLADESDRLSQSALVYQGQMDMRDKDYNAAAICFDRAARIGIDDAVTETALYNYAAATMAGGRVPFGSASKLLEDFGRRYPDSEYASAVDEYLASGYMAESRFDKALERLDRIKHPGRDVLRAKQRSLYELGARALSAGQYAEAEERLRRAVMLDADRALTPQCRLWLAEALYSQKKYDAAVSAYQAYLDSVPATDANRAEALYNQAYAYYKKHDYKNARRLFAQAAAMSGSRQLTAELRADARLRQADCDNYTGNVRGALALYEAAASDSSVPGADYAAFQAACMHGVTGDNERKATGLEAMMSRWPKSDWVPAALYELAQAYIASGKVADAQRTQDRLAKVHPDSELLRESRISLAGSYADSGDTERAIAECRDIIIRWPSSKQARTASEYLQTLYSAKGRMAEYLEFVNSVPGAPKPQAGDMDRLTYFAAVGHMDSHPDDTSMLLGYLEAFPDGIYAPDARLALAGIYRQSRNSDKALEMLDNILTRRPDSDAVPAAMLAKADILSSQGDRAGAGELYKEVVRRAGNEYASDAYYGLIHNTSDSDERLLLIQRYLALPGLDSDSRDDVRRIQAATLLEAGDTAKAESLLKELASDMYTEGGGEAAVMLAGLYMKTARPKDAVKVMESFTSGGCEDQYWLARGYIALADAYAGSGNRAKARQYVLALSENYPGTDAEITNLIADRLSKY